MLPLYAALSEFRSIRIKIAWLANTRPGYLFEISQLAQITNEIFETAISSATIHLDRVVKFTTGNSTSLGIPRLDLNSLRVFRGSGFVVRKQPRSL